MSIRPETHRKATLKRRAALLAAATELVAEHGIEGVTHRAVAKRADLPSSTTSYFFASIDELVQAAVRDALEQLDERLGALAARLRDGDLDVDELLDVVVPVLLTAPPTHVAAQFHTYLRAAHPGWQEDVRDLFASLEATVSALLEAAGVDRSRANERSVIALVDGFQLQRLAGIGEDTLQEDLAEALRSLLTASTRAGALDARGEPAYKEE